MAAVAAATLLSGCGSTTPHASPNAPVDIPAFPQVSGSSGACQAILRSLPTQINHQKQRKTTGSAFGAAWGNPAIVLRCGVAEPTQFDPYASCLTVNGVDWFLEGQVPSMDGTSTPGALTITTVYRKPAISVVIPNSNGTQGPGLAMLALAQTVKAHTTVSQHCV